MKDPEIKTIGELFEESIPEAPITGLPEQHPAAQVVRPLTPRERQLTRFAISIATQATTLGAYWSHLQSQLKQTGANEELETKSREVHNALQRLQEASAAATKLRMLMAMETFDDTEDVHDYIVVGDGIVVRMAKPPRQKNPLDAILDLFGLRTNDSCGGGCPGCSGCHGNPFGGGFPDDDDDLDPEETDPDFTLNPEDDSGGSTPLNGHPSQAAGAGPAEPVTVPANGDISAPADSGQAQDLGKKNIEAGG